jgi:hypothetical protein
MLVMKGTLTIGVLISTICFADTRNAFAPDQQSSESIWVGWNSCVQKAKGRMRLDIANKYCGCAIDLARVKGSQNLTQKDLSECGEFAINDFLGSPAHSAREAARKSSWFGWKREDLKDGWDTVEIIQSISQCESAGRFSSNRNVRWATCACLTDARRSRSPTFAEDKIAENPASEVTFCTRRAESTYQGTPCKNNGQCGYGSTCQDGFCTK